MQHSRLEPIFRFFRKCNGSNVESGTGIDLMIYIDPSYSRITFLFNPQFQSQDDRTYKGCYFDTDELYTGVVIYADISHCIRFTSLRLVAAAFVSDNLGIPVTGTRDEPWERRKG